MMTNSVLCLVVVVIHTAATSLQTHLCPGFHHRPADILHYRSLRLNNLIIRRLYLVGFSHELVHFILGEDCSQDLCHLLQLLQ